MPIQPNKLSTPVPKLSAPVIVVLGFIAFLVAAVFVKNGIEAFDYSRSATVTSQSSIPVPSPSVIPPGSYAIAIERAMGAAKDTQTAKSQAEWALVSDQWRMAIDNLKRIPATDPNHADAQKRLGQYQKNLAYADLREQKAAGVQTQAIALAPSVAKPGIGVGRYEIQSAFEQSNVGFIFEASSPVHGEGRVMGKVPNGMAVVELIGDTQNLSSAAILFAGQGSQEQLKLSGLYALLFLERTAPNWNGRMNWLADAASEIDNKDAVSVLEGDRLITLKKFGGSHGLLILTVKPASEGG